MIRVGTNVQEHLGNDLKLELGGVKTYNEALELVAKSKDAGSRDIQIHQASATAPDRSDTPLPW